MAVAKTVRNPLRNVAVDLIKCALQNGTIKLQGAEDLENGGAPAVSRQARRDALYLATLIKQLEIRLGQEEQEQN